MVALFSLYYRRLIFTTIYSHFIFYLLDDLGGVPCTLKATQGVNTPLKSIGDVGVAATSRHSSRTTITLPDIRARTSLSPLHWNFYKILSSEEIDKYYWSLSCTWIYNRILNLLWDNILLQILMY